MGKCGLSILLEKKIVLDYYVNNYKNVECWKIHESRWFDDRIEIQSREAF